MAIPAENTGSGTLPKSTGEPGAGFRAPVAAHEMGHAVDFETRRAPLFRRALERALWLGGKGSSLLAQARGRPIMAAVGQLAAGVPELYSEGEATVRGLQAMKASGKYTPEEYAKARNTLLWAGSTYLMPRLVDAGMAAGVAHVVNTRPDITTAIESDPQGALGAALGLGMAKRLGKLVTGLPLGYAFESSSKKAPPMTPAEAEELRKQMKVKAQIHSARPEIFGENAAYFMPGQHKGWGQKIKEEQLNELLSPSEEAETPEQRKRRIRTILQHGGILLPQQAKLGSADKKEPGLAKRIAKGLGLGAVTLGTAGGLIAASDPKMTKRVYQAVKQYGLKGLKTVKLSSADQQACETLSRTHWPALAKVLVT